MDALKSAAGQTIKSPSGYTAFLPNPLPPKVIPQPLSIFDFNLLETLENSKTADS